MGTAIQLRRGSALPPSEMHYVGEPLWDDLKSRLGIFNNRSGQEVEWYPTVIGNKMIMNQNQTLGGYDASGVENPVYLDFGTPGVLKVKDRNLGTEVASFAQSGSVFSAALALSTPYIGLTNKAVNGNLSVVKEVFPLTLADTNVVAQRSYCVAPNWQLWKQFGTNGRLTASFDSDVPFASCPRSMRIASIANPDNSGLRTFVYGAKSMKNTQYTFSWYVKGTNAKVAGYRIITEQGTVLLNTTFTANGAWQRLYNTLTIPDDGSDVIYIDILYNPASNSLNSLTWRIAAFQCELGTNTTSFENRPEAFERALVLPIYSEGFMYLPTPTSVGVGSGLLSSTSTVQVEAKNVTEPTKKPVINNKTKLGFTATVTGAVGPTVIEYSIYSYPTTTETA